LLEPQLTTSDQLGINMARTGSRAETNAPRGLYETADGRWIAVSASTAKTAKRMVTLLGRADVAEEPWMDSAEQRVAHWKELDAVIIPWFAARDAEDVLAACREAGAPAALVYDAADILADDQFNATGAVSEVEHEQLGPLRMPGPIFRMSRTPGAIKWAGREVGADNEEVFGALGIDADERARLREEGTI
jgi:crotonobetainyl-CoA:carnitine CoA-transferase CaiB-like acyl-CoA transferase